MTAAAIIQMVLFLLKGVTAAFASSGSANIASEAIDGINAAITKLEEVHGSDITKGQLDSLRVTPQW